MRSLLHSGGSAGDRLGIGPQYSKDPQFTARMRLHQSWYRSTVLREPYGTGPSRNSTSFYGNMLAERAGDAGRNFLTAGIHEIAARRMRDGGGVEPFRCRRNMLSSQPMCFNLFGPLVTDLDLATRLLAARLPREVACVTRVAIELAPKPRRAYLDDRTSFDAFVEYERVGGGLAFLGIETKLTEPFSIDDPASASKYLALTRMSPSTWPTASYDKLANRRWCQLWRNHLLAEALLRRERARYVAGRCVAVHHPGDVECTRAVTGYRALLADAEGVLDWNLDVLVSAWRAVMDTRPADAAWLDAFRVRYLDLSPSRDQ